MMQKKPDCLLNYTALRLNKAHTYFRYLWKWRGEETEIMSRAH